jgi:hypothetical protein
MRALNELKDLQDRRLGFGRYAAKPAVRCVPAETATRAKEVPVTTAPSAAAGLPNEPGTGPARSETVQPGTTLSGPELPNEPNGEDSNPPAPQTVPLPAAANLPNEPGDGCIIRSDTPGSSGLTSHDMESPGERVSDEESFPSRTKFYLLLSS